MPAGSPALGWPAELELLSMVPGPRHSLQASLIERCRLFSCKEYQGVAGGHGGVLGRRRQPGPGPVEMLVGMGGVRFADLAGLLDVDACRMLNIRCP